jgi:hypothetical protein
LLSSVGALFSGIIGDRAPHSLKGGQHRIVANQKRYCPFYFRLIVPFSCHDSHGKAYQVEPNQDSARRAFAHTGDGSFAVRLPDTTGDQLIVEFRMRPGESVATLHQWLAGARIASEELIPTLTQRRMPGAVCRALNAQEVQLHGDNADALLFCIRNASIELEGKLVPIFAVGRVLMIKGSIQNMPDTIFLHTGF